MTQPLDAIEIALVERIDNYRPAMVEFCSRLLQIPSVNGVHDEIAVAEAITAQAQRLGLHAQLVVEQPRRPNVIVSTWARGDTGLLLLGHLDTVPPGDAEAWDYPPFSGTVTGGCIYGRGAIDTKGGMTSALYALAAIAGLPDSLHGGRVQLICVPNEESGATGELGIKFLARNGLLDALGAIYAYSGHDIALGHRGLIRFRLLAEGESAHTGSRAWQNRTAGANAVTAMARLLLLLEAIDLPFSTSTHFEDFKTVVTPGTMISGGAGVSIVPDRCEALVDVRLTPEHNRESILGMLEEAVARASADAPGVRFRYEVLNHIPAAISDEDAPLFSIVEDVVEQLDGRRPERVVAGPANEGYLLIEHGIPTLCGLGPAGQNAHAPNEYVEIDGLVQAARIFAVTARRMSRWVG